MKFWTSRVIISLAAALLPSLVLLSFTPNIIRANARDIAFTTNTVHAVWVAFVVVALLLIVASITRERLVVLLTCLAVNVFLWNALDHSVWLHSPWLLSLAVAAEVSVFALVLLVLSRLPFALVTRAAAFGTLLLVAFSAMDHRQLLDSLPAPNKADAGPYRPDLPIIPDKLPAAGNVYHIVLDAFASPYMTKRLNEGSVDLSGYTFYPNAIANYGRTNLSMRSVFTGKLHPTPITIWNTAFEGGLTDTLARAGIPLAYFPFYKSYCDDRAGVCHPTTELYPFYREHIDTTFVLDIAFQNALPISLRNYGQGSLEHAKRPTETWDYGFSVTSWLAGLVDPADAYPKWRYPLQSLTMETLQDFLDTEETLPATGRYTYLHVMAPHGPYVFDRDCTFLAPEDRYADYEAVERQFACAVTIIERIKAKLKQLDRFDNSLIVIHGDHGVGDYGLLHQWDPKLKFDPSATFLDRDVDDISAVPEQWVQDVSGALLLVHFPGQSGFSIDQKDAQLVDVGPTILQHFGLDPANMDGYPLGSPPRNREVVYFESATDALERLGRLAKFVRRGGRWSFDSWSQVGPE